jgi:DNA-dependent RNA polymerase
LRRGWEEYRKRQQALRARKAVGGAKVSLEPSELLVNAAVAEGITSIATVDDSFGCLPSRAERFRRIIREQFMALYKEH